MCLLLEILWQSKIQEINRFKTIQIFSISSININKEVSWIQQILLLPAWLTPINPIKFCYKKKVKTI